MLKVRTPAFANITAPSDNQARRNPSLRYTLTSVDFSASAELAQVCKAARLSQERGLNLDPLTNFPTIDVMTHHINRPDILIPKSIMEKMQVSRNKIWLSGGWRRDLSRKCLRSESLGAPNPDLAMRVFRNQNDKLRICHSTTWREGICGLSIRQHIWVSSD